MSPTAPAYTQYFSAGIRPDPLLTVSEWSDRHRKLSQRASAEPGQWRTSRTPYLKEIMDALSPSSPVEEVVFMKGAQVGASESGNNWIGFVIDYAPGPMLAVLPTVELAKRTSKQRIAPLIEESPRLKAKVRDARSRDSGNTMLSKEYPGGILILTGANSAVGLRAMPARYLLLDEIDAFPGDVDGEGEPCALAEARTRTFARRKILKVSTPTFEGRSRIQTAFQQTDQREYHVPCPHCAVAQVLRWERIRWEKGKPDTAVYACTACDKPIDESHKTAMLAAGVWMAKHPERSGKVAGFHLSSLYSPVGWLSWRQIAKEWETIQATKSQDRLRVFINTVLGETWKERGDAPDWERLYARREKYKIGCPPAGVHFLTAGVDVQRDRIEFEVVGWGPGKESWSVEYRVLMGDTSQPHPWQELGQVISSHFESEDGRSLPIQVTAIDSGYNTQAVYDFVRRYQPNRVIAIKGQSTAALVIGQPSTVDVSTQGRRLRRGVKVWPVGVDLIKSELYGWLKLPTPQDGESVPHGFRHFPEYDAEYFKQLTAEELIKRVVKGFTKFEWEKVRERNEALDTGVYNRAAAAFYGIDRLTDEQWAALKMATPRAPAAPKGAPPPEEPPSGAPPRQPRGVVKRRASKWL